MPHVPTPAQHGPRARRSLELAAPFGTGRAHLGAILPALFFLSAFQTAWVGTRHSATTHPREHQHLMLGGAITHTHSSRIVPQDMQGWLAGCRRPSP